MKKNLNKLLDKLFANSHKAVPLKMLEKMMHIGIPFNGPHKFKFLEISNHQASLKLGNKRVNQNHLGGIHACAIATLGEFSAGLLLCKNFGISKYRIVLSEIKANYSKQGRTDLIGTAKIDNAIINKILSDIENEDKALIEFKTVITNEFDEEVAVVTTQWQLKDWSKTSMK